MLLLGILRAHITIKNDRTHSSCGWAPFKHIHSSHQHLYPHCKHAIYNKISTYFGSGDNRISKNFHVIYTQGFHTTLLYHNSHTLAVYTISNSRPTKLTITDKIYGILKYVTRISTHQIKALCTIFAMYASQNTFFTCYSFYVWYVVAVVCNAKYNAIHKVCFPYFFQLRSHSSIGLLLLPLSFAHFPSPSLCRLLHKLNLC